MWYVQHCWLLSWAAYLPDRGWPRQLPLSRPALARLLHLQVRNNSAFSGPRWMCVRSLLHVKVKVALQARDLCLVCHSVSVRSQV